MVHDYSSLIQHLKKRFQPVFDVRIGKIPGVNKVRFDEPDGNFVLIVYDIQLYEIRTRDHLEFCVYRNSVSKSQTKHDTKENER